MELVLALYAVFLFPQLESSILYLKILYKYKGMMTTTES
tara:strand:- start:5467 stop:5583 length:117 start_codon:yes stop_codon:yes gene_type:complete